MASAFRGLREATSVSSRLEEGEAALCVSTRAWDSSSEQVLSSPSQSRPLLLPGPPGTSSRCPLLGLRGLGKGRSG